MCMVCGREQECGLGLCFVLQPDGSVATEFVCAEEFQGYPGMLHGGLIATLIDGAMTNCLFAHGLAGVTGELTVRFRRPVEPGAPLQIKARITRRVGPLALLEATVRQFAQVCAEGQGKFVQRDVTAPRTGPP